MYNIHIACLTLAFLLGPHATAKSRAYPRSAPKQGVQSRKQSRLLTSRKSSPKGNPTSKKHPLPPKPRPKIKQRRKPSQSKSKLTSPHTLSSLKAQKSKTPTTSYGKWSIIPLSVLVFGAGIAVWLTPAAPKLDPNLPPLDEVDKNGNEYNRVPPYYGNPPIHVQMAKKEWDADNTFPYTKRQAWYTKSDAPNDYIDQNAYLSWTQLPVHVKYHLVQSKALERLAEETTEEHQAKIAKDELKNKQAAYLNIQDALNLFTFTPKGIKVDPTQKLPEPPKKTAMCLICCLDVPNSTIVHQTCNHNLCLACLGRLPSKTAEEKNIAGIKPQEYRCPTCNVKNNKMRAHVYAAHRLTQSNEGSKALHKQGIQLYKSNDDDTYYCADPN